MQQLQLLSVMRVLGLEGYGLGLETKSLALMSEGLGFLELFIHRMAHCDLCTRTAKQIFHDHCVFLNKVLLNEF